MTIFTNLINILPIRSIAFILVLLLFLGLIQLLRYVTIRRGKRLFHFIRSVCNSITEALSHNPDVKRLIKRHQKFFYFLHNRFSPGHFTGLPLTLLTFAFLYTLALFFGLAEELVRQDPRAVDIDIQLANLSLAFRDPNLIIFFMWITALGIWQIVVSYILLFTFVLWRKHQTIYLLPLWVTFLGSQLITTISKLAIHRARPSGLVPAYMESSFSFPSGHTTVAAAFYGFVTYYLWRTSPKWRWKINWLFAGLILIISIGFSRLYLGVHFLSDVNSGYLVGLFWLIIGISILEWRHANQPPDTTTVSQLKKTTFVGLLILMIILYTTLGWLYIKNTRLQTMIKNQPLIPISNTAILQSFDQDKLPRVTKTLAGTSAEPISFIIITPNDQQLINDFQTAGWQLADPINLHSLSRAAQKIISHGSYPHAPITPAFWNDQVHDLGFEKQTTKQVITERHHARFWKTPLITVTGESIFFGTVSYDTSLKWFVTHKIEPAVDMERDLLLSDLKQTSKVISSQRFQLVPPTLGKNFVGDQFFTDGQAVIIQLN